MQLWNFTLFQHPARIETDTAIRFADAYIFAIEAQLPIIEKQQLKSVERQVANPPSGEPFDPEEISELYDKTSELIEKGIFRSVRYSMIVYLHTLFETQMVRVCRELKEEKNLPIKLSDLTGSEIERAKKYLVNVAGLPVKDLHNWTILSDFQKMRDCIIHQNGTVKNSRHEKRIRELPGAYNGIAIDADEKISFDFEVCKTFYITIAEFFSMLFDVLKWEWGMKRTRTG